MPGMREAARAVQAYTERHVARLNRLLQASFLLDFTLDRAHILSPLEASPCLCGYPTFATFNPFACLVLALEASPCLYGLPVFAKPVAFACAILLLAVAGCDCCIIRPWPSHDMRRSLMSHKAMARARIDFKVQRPPACETGCGAQAPTLCGRAQGTMNGCQDDGIPVDQHHLLVLAHWPGSLCKYFFFFLAELLGERRRVLQKPCPTASPGMLARVGSIHKTIHRT